MSTSVVRFLASGGFGAVYKYDSKKGLGVVARKVFNINMERSAKHERMVLAKIGHHDNIVVYKGSGIIPAGFCAELVEGAPFIDFDFIDGPSLWNLCFEDDMARDWVNTLPKLCDIFRGLLAAVNHVHSLNFIHLDLKPGNVMVVKSKAGDCLRLKAILIDFGVTQHTNDQQHLKDHYGTDGYQPPEWWAGAVPTKSYDVWALGVIFYELLYGQRAVPINDSMKRMRNRGKGNNDTNDNGSKSAITVDNTDTAERKERLRWQKKYNMAMEKASSEIQLIPRKNNRFLFTVPNDVHALVLHMLGQVMQRPAIKEILASPMFKSVHEGTYEQQQFAKHQAYKKVDELQSEKKQFEKQVSKLEEQLKHVKQCYEGQAAAPKPPIVQRVDMAVGTEGEDDLAEARRECKNLEVMIKDNNRALEECCAQLEEQENKLERECNDRLRQEGEFANEKAALVKELQRVSGSNAKLEKDLREAESRHSHELEKANAVIAALQEKLAVQSKSAAAAVIECAFVNQQPQQRQQQQQQQQPQEQPPDTTDLLAQALNFSGIEQHVFSRGPIEASKRTTNDFADAAISKRLRTVPELIHLSMQQYLGIIDAVIETAKLPNADAAWKALDWAYGLYRKNKGDISKPPDALQQVIVDHSKQGGGKQTTSAFEEWLILVLQHLSTEDDTLQKRSIFTKLTGRSANAYATLTRRYKK